ncbi:arabinose ABC transporter permease [Variovorax paradoxus]|jgi:MFS family permease|uniref:MFS transporter n=1 Tax=Variovorax TaxID=34072 RepID=UPI0006E6AAFF|nr:MULTISPECIES: MFS transporter [unclassified Variovorax]KPU93303.1 arabinose ABC transporter permease [Variovorax paradoxus]KPU94580.1 arabinose ABC transporter permease [Variovorax paradoxus]KPV10252.1 arabinose ABC transporter permease [Variovorax paradoxus]KPV15091.1 arabinose ABC transporter permease [Variovorax paradoxus]KPV27108.1 arabinose ABC transporter permease [Variovorax paradoxus]
MTTSSISPQGASPVPHTSDTAAPDDDHSRIDPGEIAVGVVIGRASEYFDFFVYGIASVLVFPAVFFPFEQRLEGTLWAFVVFSFAFIARPFGTVISMEIQRRFGRETKLTLALFVLGTSTAGIAFLPGYASLGFTSIVLLSIFRFGQGLAFGGSWDGLPSLLALNAPANRRGWYAMLGQLGAPIGFFVASALFAYLYSSLTLEDFLDWGWRYTFYVAFAINVVALFARLRLVAADEYARLLEERELQPTSVVELVRSQGSNLLIGAFAALASYALFHLITVFPLSWITLYSNQAITEFLVIQMIGAVLGAGGIVASGLIADRIGRRFTLGGLAALIAVFSGFAPTLLDGGKIGQDVFILLGFILLGLSYGQAAGAVTGNFEAKYRYTGAALTTDLAWLIGAAFAPLVALGLSAHFGLAYVSVYLLSGAAGTLAALGLNRALVRD